MKATIKQPHNGDVELSYDEYFSDERVTRTFYVPLVTHDNATYVFERLPDGRRKQPCKALDCNGPTLVATRETLLDAIRNNYQLMRRREKAYSV